MENETNEKKERGETGEPVEPDTTSTKFDLRQFVKSWVLPLVAEVAVLLVIFNFVINITYVPTGSMIPTIAEHSVLISLREYNTDELQRGEIYSFHSEELDKTLIKRLIGPAGRNGAHRGQRQHLHQRCPPGRALCQESGVRLHRHLPGTGGLLLLPGG